MLNNNKGSGGLMKPALSADHYILGTNKKDVLSGSRYDDTVVALKSNDLLNGDLGNDTMYGNAGNDKLNGEAGNDSLYGNEGADTLKGGSGNDRLDGGEGNDILNGGSGKDTYVFKDFGSSFGFDTIVDDGDGKVDIIDATRFNSDNLVFVRPLDLNHDEQFDAIELRFGGELMSESLPDAKFGSITIEHFFDNNSSEFAHGANEIVLRLSDVTLDFDGIVDLISS